MSRARTTPTRTARDVCWSRRCHPRGRSSAAPRKRSARTLPRRHPAYRSPAELQPDAAQRRRVYGSFGFRASAVRTEPERRRRKLRALRSAIREGTMESRTLEDTARAIVAGGKGILAADETPRTLTTRFDALSIPSTADSRRDYREMLFSTPEVAEFIGGVIMQDETIRQKSAKGTPLVQLVIKQGMIPGIKVDDGARPMAGAPGERITEGLDGLRGRLDEYHQLGARFAKWRAVFIISSDGLPSARCLHANADALARYAALCQEQGMVPIVEPEVLMNGSHTIERCEE